MKPVMQKLMNTLLNLNQCASLHNTSPRLNQAKSPSWSHLMVAAPVSDFSSPLGDSELQSSLMNCHLGLSVRIIACPQRFGPVF